MKTFFILFLFSSLLISCSPEQKPTDGVPVMDTNAYKDLPKEQPNVPDSLPMQMDSALKQDSIIH